MSARIVPWLVGLAAIATVLVPRVARADDEDVPERAPNVAPPAPPPPPRSQPTYFSEERVPSPSPSTGPSTSRVGALLSGGASYRTIFSLPVQSWNVGVGVGADVSEHLAVYARGTFEQGQTSAGLSTHFVQMGVTVEGIFDRVRPGIGVDVLDYFRLERISNATALDRFGIGLYLSLSVDLVRFETHAVYLGLRLDADALPPASLLGASGGLGIRW